MKQSSSTPADAHGRLREGFASGVTRDLDFRIGQLRKLRDYVQAEEEAIYRATASDLGRGRMETLLLELTGIHSEIRYFLKNLKRLARPRVVTSNPAQRMQKERSPLGVVLQIAPFNLPIYLCVRPLIGALAAGNCVVVKPSELTPACEQFVKSIESVLDPRVFAVVTGGVDVASELLALRWDHISYTGGVRVGRIVMEAAAKHLTPVMLELGGKNPAFVTKNADMQVAASSILFSRFFNAGQICLAADYCLVEDSVFDAFKAALLKRLQEFFGDDARSSTSFCRLVSSRHFERVAALLDASKGSIIAGGDRNAEDLYIAPTVVEVAEDDALMKEEIFGPVLCVLRVSSLQQGIDIVNKREKPLALYAFSNDKDEASEIAACTSSGSMALNDTISQISADGSHLGGVGESGMGAYGQEASFATFSHDRPCLYRASWWAKLNQAAHQSGWTTKDGGYNHDLDRMIRNITGIPSPSATVKSSGTTRSIVVSASITAVVLGGTALWLSKSVGY